MAPLTDRNYLKSQKFLERCRDRLTRPVTGSPDALVEDSTTVTSAMLADPLGALFNGLAASSAPAASGSPATQVANAVTALEDQYRLVEQALLYLTEDLARSA